MPAISFSLHPFSYPYELTGSALFIIQPISDLSGLSHRLLLVYLKEIALSDFFFYTCCNCGTFLHPVNTLFLYGKNGLDFGLQLNVLLAG